MIPLEDRKQRETKEPLDESEKAGLKCNTQKNKIMASSPITSWQIDGGKNGNSDRFYFLDSKVTVDDDCSHGIKRCLLFGRKTMTNLDSRLKSRHIILPSHDFSSSCVWL